MDTALVLFTRDLRVHDNPALAGACRRARQVVPLFVVDPAITVPPNRATFLAESVAVLRDELRGLGGDLIVREGDPVAETVKLAVEAKAAAVFVAADVSRYAGRRQERLAEECEQHRMALEVTPGHQIVPAGELRPSGGGDHFRMFTPYWRAWSAACWRRQHKTPEKVELPPGLSPGRLPAKGTGASKDLVPGGETAGRKRARAWVDGPLKDYAGQHDALAADDTSRLSAYLRFGCVSPLSLAKAAKQHGNGGDEFVRQLCWRDFFHQVTAAFPDMAKKNYRPGGTTGWSHDSRALDAWRAGQTGVPVVDAGMRQLAAEGYMHNRARLITASFLTRNLVIDWREGYAHFAALLADADVANNAGNWQWVAGTGNNSQPNRVMNPLRQATRFDHDGEYVRRWVPELAGLSAPHIHTPWKLPAAQRRALDYPQPLIDLG
jgi:deoxyribodipyrimidine photo-lyase